MLRSDTLFGKRETNPSNSSLGSTGSASAFSANTTHSSNPPAATPNAGLHKPPASNTTHVATQNAVPASNGAGEAGSKLIVGPNIKLKGVEITDCDTLVVEGFVEATMDSRVMQIAQNGSFKGSAEIDIAEIRGVFDGELTVRQKLMIYATGKVSGKIRYGNVVIEEGGQLAGDVQVGGNSAASQGLAAAKSA